MLKKNCRFLCFKCLIVGRRIINKHTTDTTTGGVLKNVILKNAVIFTGKHLYWSLFLIKLQSWGSSTFFKWDSSTDVFLRILEDKKTLIRHLYFGKFHKIHSFYLIKLKAWHFIKKKLQHRCFHVNFNF